MLALLGLIVFLIGSVFFLSVAAVWYYMAKEEFDQPFLVLCPETMQAADIHIDARRAVATRFAGHEEDKITRCTRRPERAECDEACATQVQLLGDSRSFQKIAAFGLQPHQLRIFNPRRMTIELYNKLMAQLSLQRNNRSA